MTLLNPWGLAGLLSLPVILALHLLRDRQRRYVVSDVDLWSFLEHEPRGPQTRRLPITLLLLFDLLIAALLSLALAQPRISLAIPSMDAKHWVLLVDISTSMRAIDNNAQRIDSAKALINDVISSAGPNDQITLLSFGRTAHLVGDTRQMGFADLEATVASLEAGETVTSRETGALQSALAMGLSQVDPEKPAEFYVYTDGSFHNEDLESMNSFKHPIVWQWFGSETGNQAVVSLNSTLLEPGQLQIFTKVANFSQVPAVREIVLEIDGRAVGNANLDLPAESSVSHFWVVQTDITKPPVTASVILQGEDSLADDNRAFIGLQSGGVLRVALVTENPAPLQQAVEVFSGAELVLIAPQDYRAENYNEFDLTIFRGYVPQHWPAGLILVVDPPGEGEVAQASAETAIFYSSGREPVPADAPLQMNRRNQFLEGIDFSGVRWTRAWIPSTRLNGFVTLLQAGESPLLQTGQIESLGGGRSQVLVLLADLSRGNFTRHPAFPIFIATIISNSRHSPLPPSFLAGEHVVLPSTGVYQAIQIVKPNQSVVEMEGPWPEKWTQTLDPGFYTFRLIAENGSTRSFVSAANAGEISESDLRPGEWVTRIEENTAQSPVLTESQDREIDLWVWLLMATIALLIAEASLAWRRQ